MAAGMREEKKKLQKSIVHSELKLVSESFYSVISAKSDQRGVN